MLEDGTLWNRMLERNEHALNCGALQPIPTEYEFVEQDGIRFLVRVLSSLARKEEDRKRRENQDSFSEDVDPFLPYDEDLFVADLSDTHVGLLNKYSVIDNHLLIVTRAFEEQESLLTLADFEALLACMAECDGLAFYNSGEAAGASQQHKHMQLVPLPLAHEGSRVPIGPAIASVKFRGSTGTTSRLPFRHAIVRLDNLWNMPLSEAAQAALDSYHALLRAVGLYAEDRQPDSYNLLLTRRRMLVVPRSREHFESISVNALGFAGALLVRNAEELKLIKERGPMTALRSVAMPA